MRSFKVQPADSGIRLDRFLFSALPDVAPAVIRKAFKDKDVKLNGTREKEIRLVETGDIVELYVSEDRLTGNTKSTNNATIAPTPLSIVYEDADVLIASKPQGVLVQDDPDVVGPKQERSFERIVRQAVKSRGDVFPKGFPALCHRIDRNTGGLVLFAKHQAALDTMTDAFMERNLRKEYLCIVVGVPKTKKTELNAFLEKVPGDSRVYIHDVKKANNKPIKTRYEVLASKGNLSLLLVEIITGRTHQIRAQLAWIGHPIAGDGKYGSNTINRQLHLKYQALWSWRMSFSEQFAETSLPQLAGLKVSAKDIHWEPSLDIEFGELTSSLMQ